MDFKRKPVIACVHLLPTPGSHRYDGDIGRIYEVALWESRILAENGVDALVVENFRDRPFYPDTVPPETVALMAGVSREIVKSVDIPVGIAVLRNDPEAAIAIATAVGATFVRINVHVGAILTAQGLLEGKSHKSLRLRQALKSNVSIYADAGVKHSTPFAYKELSQEVRDLAGVSEAVIVSGELTGMETSVTDLITAKRVSTMPILVGSGVTIENLENIYDLADGFIVGSAIKQGGNAMNLVEESRVKAFMAKVSSLRSTRGFNSSDTLTTNESE